MEKVYKKSLSVEVSAHCGLIEFKYSKLIHYLFKLILIKEVFINCNTITESELPY